MKKYLILPVIILGTLLIVGCSNSSDEPDIAQLQRVTDSGEIAAEQELFYDWGDINIAGGTVKQSFTLNNKSRDNLILKGASTSCMCTDATIITADGKASPKFGMHQNPNWATVVGPKDDFVVDVVFDPMAHGPNGTGPIQRSVAIVSSSKVDGELTKETMHGKVTEIRVMGNVLSEADYKAKYSERVSAKEVIKKKGEGVTDHHDQELPEYEVSNMSVLQKVKAKEEFILIDVREDNELEESGVIEGAIHIPLGSLSMDSLEKSGISKSDEIIVYCRSGNRSRQAYDILTSLGFTNVKSMEGGILHWQEDQRPLTAWIK